MSSSDVILQNVEQAKITRKIFYNDFKVLFSWPLDPSRAENAK